MITYNADKGKDDKTTTGSGGRRNVSNDLAVDKGESPPAEEASAVTTPGKPNP